jgi:hypothetical protein
MYKAVNITDAAPDPGVQTSVLHKRYLSSWHAATRALRKLRCALKRLQGGGLARFLTRWCEFASGARRHQMRQHNALRRAAGLTQLRVLYQWRLSAKTSQTTSDRARRAILSMINFCVARSFRRWVSACHAPAQARAANAAVSSRASRPSDGCTRDLECVSLYHAAPLLQRVTLPDFPRHPPPHPPPSTCM